MARLREEKPIGFLVQQNIAVELIRQTATGMKYVLDSSVALKWVLPEADSVRAIRLRDEHKNGISRAPRARHLHTRNRQWSRLG